jgi:hydrogenase expression/formation protein HypD
MRYLDEYRDSAEARRLLQAIEREVAEPCTLMEVCGGQTHNLIRFGIDQLLPESVRLVHGPGCPVCVTPLDLLDHAMELAATPGITLVSFGDMLRVPGSHDDLLTIKARGGAVHMVYSPLDALKLAQRRPDQQVVFFGVGFETTAPANAMAVWQARRLGLENFSLLCSHVRVPPAMEFILESPGSQVQAFLAAGHVCTICGLSEYRLLARRHRVPIVITGFEPLDLLSGILLAVRALRQGRWEVENPYSRVVRTDGNPEALALLDSVFEICDRPWRGIGDIPQSGYRLRSELAKFDAARRFPRQAVPHPEPPCCRAGEVLLGSLRPDRCSAFGKQCTPDHPLGAPMVSSEGACAAYYQYGRARV